MKIGDVASRAGLDAQTVRYYEREGLLEVPARLPSGYRSYGPHHLERLNFIRHCRSLDMPLADVRQLIDLSASKSVSCEQVDALVQSHLERVRAKLSALSALENQLSALRSQCDSGHRVANCGILEELIHAGHGEACACHPVQGRKAT
jgi:DNA-binding transcriptional MerR regulator